MQYKGRRLFVIKRNFELKDYYCGYVEMLLGDYYFGKWGLVEQELFAPGGITYTPAYGKLNDLPFDGDFIGFDTFSYLGVQSFSKEQAFDACLRLITEIERKNFEN